MNSRNKKNQRDKSGGIRFPLARLEKRIFANIPPGPIDGVLGYLTVKSNGRVYDGWSWAGITDHEAVGLLISTIDRMCTKVSAREVKKPHSLPAGRG